MRNSLWDQRAEITITDEVDNLRRVLDPADTLGIKNTYIDLYFKFYLLKCLDINENDKVLEIGCGFGRLTEYVAQYCKRVSGIDIVDYFIEECRSNDKKLKNTFYYKYQDRFSFNDKFNKCYIVWVCMYFSDDNALCNELSSYVKILDNLEKFIIIEQVKPYDEVEQLEGEFYCKYRTVETYENIFENAGLTVKQKLILGERTMGFCSTLLFNHYIYCHLPRLKRASVKKLFLFDKFLFDKKLKRRRIINRRNRPIDVAFILEPKHSKN